MAPASARPRPQPHVRRPRRTGRPSGRAPEPTRRRGLLPSAILVFAIGALCVVRSLLPSDFVGETWETGGAQFAAFYLTLLGVGLLQSNNNARRFVCFVAWLLVLLALLAVLTGETADRLVGFALLALAIGMLLLLFGGTTSPARAVAGAVVASIGAAAFFPAEIALARAPREEARRRINEWRESETSVARDDVGVRLVAPEGWVVLRRGSPFVPVDPHELVALVHEPTEARAVFTVDPELHPGESVDEALDRLIARWRRRERSFVDGERGVIELGAVNGIWAEVKWKADGTPWTGQAIAWHDATRALFLVAWFDSRGRVAALPAVKSLTTALSLSRPLTAHLAATVREAGRELPQLTPRALELLVTRRPEADAPGLFRDALVAMSIGFSGLDRVATRDMVTINDELYGGMSRADTVWMADYVGRVRAAAATTSEEDARAMRTMGAAVNKLPADARERLRGILERSVVAALRG